MTRQPVSATKMRPGRPKPRLQLPAFWRTSKRSLRNSLPGSQSAGFSKRLMRCPHFAFCAALLLACPPFAAAEGGGLFSADAGTAALRRPARSLFAEYAHPEAEPSSSAFSEFSDSAGLRSRSARMDLDRLSAARRDIGEGRPVRLNLNLFADAEFDVVMERTEPTASGYSLTGRVVDDPLSTVVVAVSGDAAAGKVWSHGAVYTIRSTGGGALIREVGSSALPRCEGPATPPPAPKAAIQATEPSVTADSGDIIDLLVVYSPIVRRAEGGVAAMRALIDRDVAAANEAYRAGGAMQRVRLVAATEVDYMVPLSLYENSKALHELADELDGEMDEVHALRDSYAADLVLLHKGEKNLAPGVVRAGIGGGIAWILSSRSPEAAARFGFSVASSWAFAHELGHNMGLGHEWAAEPRNDLLYPYGRGYEVRDESRTGDPGVWYTIMHTAGGGKINRFSNPNQRYPDESGVPLGVPGDDRPVADDPEAEGPADAVRSLNNTRRIVASFRAGAGRCAYALSPHPSDLPVEGGEFKVRVRAARNCSWTARTHDGFVSVAEESASGHGDGEITYRIQRNQDGDREAALLVAGEVYHLKQKGPRALTPVCDRSRWIQRALYYILPEEEGRSKSCSEITAADLATVGIIPGHPFYGAEVLEKGDLDGLSNLQILQVDSSSSVTVHRGVFEGLPNLLEVHLRAGPSLNLPVGAFDGLSNLAKLIISGDSITLPPGVFNNLPNLAELEIHAGGSLTLPPGVFSSLSNLARLEIESASSLTLPPHVFSELSALSRLTIRAWQDNDVPVILNSDFFVGLSSLRDLQISATSLEIGAGAFRGQHNLRALDLFSPDFPELRRGAFRGLSGLRFLNISGIGLKVIEPGAFVGLNRLEDLDLRQNKLMTLKPGWSAGLTNLKNLVLNLNFLSEVPPLQGMAGLEEMYLIDNYISNIAPLSANNWLGAGTTIWLSGNPLNSESLNSHIPSLQRRGVRVFAIPKTEIVPSNVEEGGDLNFVVMMLPPAPMGVTMSWRVVGETAEEGQDYPANLGGTFRLGAGRTHEVVSISTIDDDLVEPEETLFVALGDITPDRDFLPHELVPLGRNVSWGVQRNPGVIQDNDLSSVVGGSIEFDLENSFRNTEECILARMGVAPFVAHSLSNNCLAGGPISYRVESSNRSVAAVIMEDGIANVSAGESGVTTITLTATDSEGRTATRTFLMTVLAPPEAIGEVADLFLTGGVTEEIDLSDKFRDPDGDELEYGVESTNSGVVAASVEEGLISIEAHTLGTAMVTVTAKDSDGLSTTLSFMVTVELPRSRWGSWRSVLLRPPSEEGDGS